MLTRIASSIGKNAYCINSCGGGISSSRISNNCSLISIIRSLSSSSSSSSASSSKASATTTAEPAKSEKIVVDFSGLLRAPIEPEAPTPPKYPVIEAFKREVGTGSRVSRRLRGEGYVPGVMYAHDEEGKPIKELIMVHKVPIINEFRTRMASFESTLYELRIAGSEPTLVTARQLQFNSVNMTPVSVNFLKYKMGSIIKFPIKMINQDKSPIIKKGYLPIRINQFIDCECRADVLPDGVTIDLAGLDEQRTFRVSDIYFPPGIKPLSNISPGTIVAVIKQLK